MSIIQSNLNSLVEWVLYSRILNSLAEWVLYSRILNSLVEWVLYSRILKILKSLVERPRWDGRAFFSSWRSKDNVQHNLYRYVQTAFIT